MSGNPLLLRTCDGGQGLKVIETKRGAIEPYSDMSLQEQGRVNAHFMEEKEVGVVHVQESQSPQRSHFSAACPPSNVLYITLAVYFWPICVSQGRKLKISYRSYYLMTI